MMKSEIIFSWAVKRRKMSRILVAISVHMLLVKFVSLGRNGLNVGSWTVPHGFGDRRNDWLK